MRALALTGLLLATGCSFESGDWFATLSPSLTASYAARADRDAGDGWQRTSSDYQVRVTAARLELTEIALLGSSGGQTQSFDPAHPPPGYTLCHNGHCHSTDGRLVPYAEVEAGLAPGATGGGLQTAVTLPIGDTLDLLVPATRVLACEPSCHLDRTTGLRASAYVATLVLDGEVRDGRVPGRLPGPTAFHHALALTGDAGSSATEPVRLDAEMNLPADRDHAPDVQLQLRLELEASVFDGVEFAGPEAAASDQLLANLRAGKYLLATVSR